MPPSHSVADLMRSLGLDVDGPARWGSLPASKAAGIFAVESPTALPSAPVDLAAVRQWLERVPELRLDGTRPTQSTLAQRLGTFWVPGQTLLYVGRTTKSLASRVAGLYATELGHRRPHPGGHWLKTLRDQSRLRLWWAETDAPEEYEDALMSAFAARIPVKVREGFGEDAAVLPWANLESPAGLVRDTGLRDALLSADAIPVKPSSVRRSDPSGSIRRRIPSSVPAAPRSPRPTAAPRSASGAAAAGLRGQLTHLTAEGLADLQTELDRLRNVERPQVVERIKHARELGDLRENADYEAARNEQSFLEGRVLELEQRLRTAVVIRSETRSAISLGSIVRYQSGGQAGELTIVGSTESDPSAGRISAASPVGKALLGRRVGDDVSVTTPTAEIHYHILEIA